MKPNGVFITATDTGVGKTVVATALVAALRKRGVDAVGIKPIETGCPISPETDFASDSALLAHISDSKVENVSLYRFKEPAAPTVAARLENKEICIETIVDWVNHLRTKHQYLVIEGAGGLLVPITPEVTFADLLGEIGLPSIVVVGSRLGAINHASLTFEVLSSRSLPVLGYVLNEFFGEKTHSEMVVLETNREQILEAAQRYGLEQLALVPYLGAEPWGSEAVIAVMEVVVERLVSGQIRKT